jgi:hypothetical protein
MKRLLGVDLDGSWTFTPGIAGAGTIAFNGVTLGLNQILLITNATQNTIIYNFADATKGAASYSGGVLTLDASTAGQGAGDSLQIYVDVDEPQMIDIPSKSAMSLLLTRILSILYAPLGYAKDLQRYRATTLIESGTVTTVTTVTTCSTVSNVVQFGGLAAERIVNSANMSAWAAAHRSRIT